MKNIFERNVIGSTEFFHRKIIGIAGCGGLGSNAAVALVRAGIGKLVLADFDTVEYSNLNRQYYFLADVGKFKTNALAAHLKHINPEVELVCHTEKLSPESIPVIFRDVDVMIEAFDAAESKQWLLETWCRHFPHKPIICASGLAGIGKSDAIKIHRGGNVILCGDEYSEAEIGLCSARVAIAANMQANEALAWLWEQR